MNIKRRERMERIAFRLPPEIIRKAKALASKNRVKYSDVYRTIIVSFFEKPVNKTETVTTTEGSKEPA